MLKPHELAVPRTLGYVDPAFFTRLQQEVPKIEGGYNWSPGTPLQYAALEPFQDLVLGQCVEGPSRLEYAYDFHPVPDGRRQRGGDWHAEELAATVSDAQTSDFIILDPIALETPELAAAQARRRSELDSLFTLRELDELAKLGPDEEARQLATLYGIKIYNPEPLAVTALEGQVHRSSLNRTGEPINRGWLRVIIVGATLRGSRPLDN